MSTCRRHVLWRKYIFLCYRKCIYSSFIHDILDNKMRVVDKLWKSMAIWISVILLQFECAGPLYRPVKWQWSRTHMPSGANDFSHTWQCVALLKFIISSRVKSAMWTLVDKIVFILYAKFLSSLVNHATQSLPRRNLHIHNESSQYKSADIMLN